MYKDKDRQREANAERQRRYKAKKKACCSEGVTGGDEALPHKLNLMADAINQQVIRSPKRGKDIKCFADLPPDIRRTIERMSTVEDGAIDQSIKVNRTAIAVNYQHQFPDRYYSTGA